MFNITTSITLILYIEIVMLILSVPLLFYEIRSMWKVLFNPTTLSLVGFLFGLFAMSVSRIVGIRFESVLIRTYISSLFGLFSAVLFILWGSLVIHMKKGHKNTFIAAISLSMIGFISSRVVGIKKIELYSILSLILIFTLFMVLIFNFVVKTSPYIRARQRLFLLSLSLILFAIFDGFAARYLGTEQYVLAGLMFILEMLCRFGITLSILLPRKVTNQLNYFIK